MSWKVSINMNLGKWVLRRWIRWNWLERIIFGVEPLGYKFRESVKQ